MAERTEVLEGATGHRGNPFSRTTGPVIGTFLTGLREQVIVGTKATDGRVLVPPWSTTRPRAKRSTNWSKSAPAGTVTTYAWVPEPMPKHPVQRPFAWALIKIDGAESAMLHAVDAVYASNMSIGMHVGRARAAKREGQIDDIECFVPEGAET